MNLFLDLKLLDLDPNERSHDLVALVEKEFKFCLVQVVGDVHTSRVGAEERIKKEEHLLPVDNWSFASEEEVVHGSFALTLLLVLV